MIDIADLEDPHDRLCRVFDEVAAWQRHEHTLGAKRLGAMLASPLPKHAIPVHQRPFSEPPCRGSALAGNAEQRSYSQDSCRSGPALGSHSNLKPTDVGVAAPAIEPRSMIDDVPDWIVDSGASYGIMDIRHVRDASDRVKPARKVRTVTSANDVIKLSQEVDTHIAALQEDFTVFTKKDTASVLSLGEMCLEKGYTFHWDPYQHPQLWDRNLQEVPLRISNRVPVLDNFGFRLAPSRDADGSSSSSSSSSSDSDSSSSSSSSRDSVPAAAPPTADDVADGQGSAPAIGDEPVVPPEMVGQHSDGPRTPRMSRPSRKPTTVSENSH